MKRNLALIISVLMALAMVFTFASCGGNNGDDNSNDHVHTYGEDWQKDASAHWQVCVDHADAQANYAPHSFGDDGKCSVCGYCNHLLDNKWSSDISSHWHETNCDDHKGTKPDAAPHEFEGGTCKVCGYVCTHGYDKWSSDNVNHWYAANCSCDLKPNKDFGSHVDSDLNGACDTCAYVICTNHVDENNDGACEACKKPTDKLLYALNYLDLEAVTKMNSAIVDYYKKTVDNGYEALTDIVASVKYYDNYAVYKTVDGDTFYCSTYGDEGKLYIIRVDAYGNILRETNITEYPIGTTVTYIDLDYTVTATSNEELILDLYNLENKVGYVQSYNAETDMVSFSFAYKNEYEDAYLGLVSNVYVINVEFSIDEETNGVKAANVKIDKYETADVTLDTVADTYTVAENAEKAQEVVYGITQTFGDAFDSKDEPNPYPAEGNVITEDFTLVTKDENGNVTGTYASDEDEFKVIVGEGGVLYFDAETEASLGYSTIEFTSDSFFLMAFYDSETKQITVSSYVDGEYVLTAIVEGIELSITVVVEYNPTTEFEAEADSEKAYVGSDIIISTIVGENQNPYSEAEVVEGDESKITFTKDGKDWVVTASEVGTYVIELTSVSNPELKDRVTVVFEEAPSIAELLNGTYKGTTEMNWLDVTAVFTSVDETTGTVVLSISGTVYVHDEETGRVPVSVDVEGTYSYVYNKDTGMFALTKTQGTGVEEYLDYLAIEDYKVVVQVKNDFPCTLEKETIGGDDEPGTATTSPFEMTISDTYGYFEEDEFTFVAGEAGNYTFTVPAGYGMLVNWAHEKTNYFDNAAGAEFTLTLEAGEKVSLVAQATTKGTVEITFTYSASTGGDDEPTVEPGLAGTYTATDSWGNSFTVTITDTTISFTPPRSPMIEWTYEVDNGIVTLYVEGNAITNPSLGTATVNTTNNVFATMSYNGYEYTLTKQSTQGGDEGGDDENDGIAGTYTATDSYNNSITVVVTSDTITFTPPMSNEVVWTYVYENGTVSIFSDGTPITMPMAGYFEVSNGVPSMMIYNGTQYTISAGGSSEGGDEGNELVLGENEVPVTGDNAQMTEVTFTATQAGEYTFTAGEGVVIEYTNGYTLENESVSFTLAAGETITLYVNNMYYTAGTGLVTVAYAEGGSQEQTNTLAFGNNTIEFTAADMEAGAKEYSFYALVSGQYTFASNDVGARIFDGTTMLGMGSVHLDAGKTYTVVVLAAAEGTYTLNITAVEDQTSGGGNEEATGTEGNPTVWDEIPTEVTINSDTINKIYYTFTATQSGTLTITYPTADSWADLYPWENDQWNGQNSQSSNMQEVAEFAIESGKTYRIGIGTFNNAGEFTLPISFTEGEVGGGDENEPTGNVLVIGENTVTITEADAEQGGLMFTFTTFYAGQYTFASNDVGARVFDGEEPVGYGQVELEANKTYNVFVLAAEAGTYDLEIVFTEVGGDEPTEGTEENPIIWEEIPSEVTITSNTMDYTYFKFTATESGALVITYTNNESYAKLCELVNDEIDYEKIQNSLKKNRAQFVVEEGKTYLLGLATYNTEGEFTLPVEMGEIIPDGSQDYPFAGEFDTDYVASFIGGYTGVYYAFTVTENGYVTVTSIYEGTPWLQIGTDKNNLTNNIGYDPETYENIYGNTVSIYAFAGQTVYVAVGDGRYDEVESAEVPFKVTFEAFESDPIDSFVGTWTGEQIVWGNPNPFSMTINADGTGTVTYTEWGNEIVTNITFILVDGTSVTIKAVDAYENVTTYSFTYDSEAGTLVDATNEITISK